jgi:hypothetical protein
MFKSIIQKLWLFLERWYPNLIIKRAQTFSNCLEQDTGWRLVVREGEDGLMFFLVEPGEDEPGEDQDWWSSLDDAIFDLSDFNSLYTAF